jgi:antitoxin MazE
MKTRIQKWGDRLALRIPKPLAEEVGLRENLAVDVTIQSGKLVVTIEGLTLSLEDLARRITPRNRHSEVETGRAVGNEVC